MTYAAIRDAIAAGIIVFCGDAYHVVCTDLFGETIVFNKADDTALPIECYDEQLFFVKS